MSEPEDFLPPNATPQERAMSQTAARISDVPVPVGDLWNPDECPAALLPWLAWALSVDIWDADWTDVQKRQAIAESIERHRRKGTVWASKDAVGRVIPDAVLTEWHEYGGEPYHYRIDTADGLVDADTWQKLLPAIRHYKNVRSWLERIQTNRQLTHTLPLKMMPLSTRRLILKTSLNLNITIPPKVTLVPMTATYTRIDVRE